MVMELREHWMKTSLFNGLGHSKMVNYMGSVSNESAKLTGLYWFSQISVPEIAPHRFV